MINENVINTYFIIWLNRYKLVGVHASKRNFILLLLTDIIATYFVLSYQNFTTVCMSSQLLSRTPEIYEQLGIA